MDAAAKVLRRSFDDRLPSLAGLHTPEEDLEYFRTHLFRESEMWGAFTGQLVGFIAFAGEWIEQLYILPEWQGMGIGKVLLEIAKVKSRSLRLWTFQQNAPARQFYERHGFVPIEATDGLGNEAKAPDVLYQWIRP
ncbi:GNAT family N-acetyltransferase [Devosia salina]|uniref:GNAT family N-acetyltransferase n=1 Tax=Devosia salina TaxID=2860336 RepID=A0ABX8WKA4_9HYPH|nr:GNAT family N-acetyltransferase [Devosia salina]QYO79062.1 GNAT family N-acetyltransferase [Devosia salina]